MILYVENPKKKTHKNLLGFKNKFKKIAGYKSIYKSQLYFYILETIQN